jgi:hypothetical protein
VVGLGAWGIWDAGAGAFTTQSIFVRQSLARPESDACWRVKTAPRTSEQLGNSGARVGQLSLLSSTGQPDHVKRRLAVFVMSSTCGGMRLYSLKWGFVGCEMSSTNGLQSIYRLLVSMVSCAGTRF